MSRSDRSKKAERGVNVSLPKASRGSRQIHCARSPLCGYLWVTRVQVVMLLHLIAQQSRLPLVRQLLGEASLLPLRVGLRLRLGTSGNGRFDGGSGKERSVERALRNRTREKPIMCTESINSK